MKVNSRSFRVVVGPVICILFAIALAYVCWLIWPGSGENSGFIGWRLYIFGAGGLLAGVLLQRKRLPADGLTMALFTFFVTFIVYGGIMNVCAMVNASIMPGGAPISLSTLRLLYITGVPYDAVHAAKARGVDVLLVDTAGRLHNKKNLMNELSKINSTITKEFPEAYRETLIVLDGTTGQNALVQAKEFSEVTDISGIVLTKLDGTAKGGVVIGIVNENKIPVKFIGVGEGIDDMEVFNSKEFVEAIL